MTSDLQGLRELTTDKLREHKKTLEYNLNTNYSYTEEQRHQIRLTLQRVGNELKERERKDQLNYV